MTAYCISRFYVVHYNQKEHINMDSIEHRKRGNKKKKMEKAEKWWKRFMARDYVGFYYAQADRFQYDLLVLETEPDEFLTVPAPLMADYLELEHSRRELLEFAPIYFRIWSDDADSNARVIDREEYEEWKRESLLRQNNQAAYKWLPDADKKILDKIREKDFVLEKAQNQFGETIITEWLSGAPDHAYYHHQLACWSSWWEGMGTCQCVNHETYTKRAISAYDALDMVRKAAGANA